MEIHPKLHAQAERNDTRRAFVGAYPREAKNRIPAGAGRGDSRGTSDLSEVALRNNHLRLTELPDLGSGRTPVSEARNAGIRRYRQRWRGPVQCRFVIVPSVFN